MKCLLTSLILLIILISYGSAEISNISNSGTGNENSLILREVIFGNPDRSNILLSPDGARISYLAPINGVLNVWVAPVDDLENAKLITNDTYRGIRTYGWSYTNNHVIYRQDMNGDENWRVYVVNLTSGIVKDLTPFEKVQAQLYTNSRKFPKELIVGLNKRDPRYHDLYRINIETGNINLMQNNSEGFSTYRVDENYSIRLAQKMTADGGNEIYKANGKGGWDLFLEIPMEDVLTTYMLGFNQTERSIYLADSRGRNTAGLFLLDLDTGRESLLTQDPKADLDGMIMHYAKRDAQAAAFTYERRNWKILDNSIAGDLEYLKNLEDGDVEIVSRSLDDGFWIVAYLMDNGPVQYYYYDRIKGQAKFLFTNRKGLEGIPLAKMHPVIIKSRDNLDMVSYYTLPLNNSRDDGMPNKPLPMILYVHGGPWGRDEWGYNPVHQWLANRGYAVLSVNFRGSTGFGKNFTDAGNKEWGNKMQDDLIDAVNWSINKGIADPKKIGIMGGSYGGYATLAGLTFTPKTFACGVDIVGPSNLITLMETMPPYWQPEFELYLTRVGDNRTEEGRAFLRTRSPLFFVDRIERPLLIGHGANDPRVNENESEQIVQEMLAKRVPVTYVLYSDEGHGFVRPENKISFYAVAEAFLSQHLGGRFQSIGNDFNGSTITVPVGVEYVPGLADSLRDSLRS
jgi:dipeptidyl aminopeptidase/acylaminoacyl peptidase